ncbi:MAG: serine/threonine-protein kinase [Acidobacteriota bacterium]
MSLLLPDIEDKYDVLHKLGEGGMGAVYKVRHRLLDELRVIKVIQPQHAQRSSLQERFQREAQAAIRLRHPNVAQVHDFSIDEKGTAYTVMEFIEGLTLKQLLAHGDPPALGLTVEIALQTLGALGYLHQQGYLHRDISPDNIMLSRSFDGSLLVKLIDLGLAKRFAGDLDLTSSGMFMGKVRYASPEQFNRPTFEPDARSDLYSFGVVLYELLAGHCPIEGASFEEIVASHLIRPTPDLAETERGRALPDGLPELVMGVLAKEPQSRPTTAGELAEALRPFAEPGVPSYDELAELYRGVLEGLSGAGASIRVEGVPETFVSTVPLAEHRRRLEAKAAAADSDAPSAMPGPNSRRWLWGSLAALLLALAGSAAFWLRPGPVAPVRVVVEAVPWAEVESLADSEGLPVASAEGLITPAVFELPPGTYELKLRHPQFPPSQALELDVPTQAPPRVELGRVTVDEYFGGLGLASVLESAGN